MKAKEVQTLSATDTLTLTQLLSCSLGNKVSPGSDKCGNVRREINANPFYVGNGQDTIPVRTERFARVCLKCPVLVIAYKHMLGK